MRQDWIRGTLYLLHELWRGRNCGSPFVLVLFLLPAALLGQQQAERIPANATPEKVILPDGTPVQLRFAQALWGMAAGNRVHPVHAKPGDVVRLVVAADVAVRGKIVIQKGSVGQATVKNVWLPSVDRNGVRDICTCISLDLDWVRSLDNQNIALRAEHKGKAGPFTLQVHSTRAGAIAKPLSFRQGMIGALETGFLLNIRELIHRKDWVPAGTRLAAFVQGDVPLDDSAIDEAQKRLPVPNETGLVMIYRTKGQKDREPHVYCDSKEMGQLGSRQYVVLEMDPGKHSCRADQGETLEFSVAGGEEYYVHLKFGAFAGNWKLSVVNNLEGEDGVAAADPAGSPPQVSEPH